MRGLSFDEVVEKVRQVVPIEELLEGYGVQMRGGVGHCPFHKAKEPTLLINSARGLWVCTECHRGGDAFAFQDYTMSPPCFERDFEYLARRAGLRQEMATEGSFQKLARKHIEYLDELRRAVERDVIRRIACAGVTHAGKELDISGDLTPLWGELEVAVDQARESTFLREAFSAATANLPVGR